MIINLGTLEIFLSHWLHKKTMAVKYYILSITPEPEIKHSALTFKKMFESEHPYHFYFFHTFHVCMKQQEVIPLCQRKTIMQILSAPAAAERVQYVQSWKIHSKMRWAFLKCSYPILHLHAQSQGMFSFLCLHASCPVQIKSMKWVTNPIYRQRSNKQTSLVNHFNFMGETCQNISGCSLSSCWAWYIMDKAINSWIKM